ncbi:MAG: hypothetical protein U0414_10185 [Polyangiaceae bacterium]
MKRCRPMRAIAWLVLGGCGAIAGASCESREEGYIESVEMTTSVDTSTWTAHISAKLTLETFLYDADAHVALNTITIEEQDDDPMTFTVNAKVNESDWPRGFADDPAIIQIEADATVPESRRSKCIPSTFVGFTVGLVSDYGSSEVGPSLTQTAQLCW